MGSNSGFLCQKLAILIHAVSFFLISIFSYLSRLKKFVFLSRKDDKDMIFLEAERGGESDGDKSELHLKFKFPSFEEFSRVQKGRGESCARTNAHDLASSRRPVSAFIEVLTAFPPRETNGGDQNGETIELFSCRTLVKVDDETVGVEERKEEEEVEFGENKVEEVEFFSERSSSSDGFLSDGDFGEGLDVDSGDSDVWSFGENKEQEKAKRVEEEDEDEAVSSEFLSEKDFKVSSDKGSGEDSGDANKLESLWEHQELIEQLQMELRKVKATGLPTILEESESPKMVDDLKPWKIEETEKLQHEDRMGELHKLYKNYREMMRKLDILNYQKMYAMGFLQLKDPFQATKQQKQDSAPMLKSMVSQNLWLFKHKKHGSNPIKKLINELQGDLEVVYVGQMCLSWEFLHWQYEKALDLWNSDQQGVHRYNEVAGEFQQFQVLVQRFTEDEPFQGPRVQSYVKTRCVLRNLLQVPVIRGEQNFTPSSRSFHTASGLSFGETDLAEDCLEGEKNRGRKNEMDEYAITSEMLVEMVEESIRIFWHFVRSDKDCSCSAIASHNKLPQSHSPEDLKLLVELRKTLQKKERKLKDILRSESCILRKLRKRREEDDSDQALQFFAQVDVKLVSRVFNMSRITRDQLLWCQNKLSRIRFVNRKIYVEPAFLLFPC